MLNSKPLNLSALWLALFLGIPGGDCLLGAPAELVTADAARSYYARTWQTDDGLPRNTITAISQTPDGYLWLGTPQGVIRFDGVTFMPLEANVFSGFARARTRVVFADRLGRLWIGTETAGAIRYDGENYQVIDRRNNLPHPTISAVCEDFRGTVWLACQNGSLGWVDSDDKVHLVSPPTKWSGSGPVQLVRDERGNLWFAQADSYGKLLEGVATNITRIPGAKTMLCPSKDGGLWIIGDTKLQKLPPPESTNNFESITLPLNSRQVTCLLEDHSGNLWIGTQKEGLVRYANHEFTQELASPHRILSIFEDAESSVWVGSEGGGVNRLRPKIFRMFSVSENQPNSTLASICEAANGEVWMSSPDLSLTKFGTDGRTTNVDAFKDVRTTCVLPDPAGGILVGTERQGLYSIRNGEKTHLMSLIGTPQRQIRVLYRGAREQVWIGCLPDGLARLSGDRVAFPDEFLKQGLPPHQAIWAITEDGAGGLWLGTILGELWRHDGTRFLRYGQKEGLPGASIGALLSATNGDLWVGTLGGGLGRLRQGHFVFADTKNGLEDNVVTSIIDDGLGYFWLGTGRGICRVKKQELDDFADGKQNQFDSILYGKDEGLQSVECIAGYQPAAWRTAAGKIWFATSKGALMVDPALLPINPVPPPLVLEKILLNNTPVTNRAEIKIAYGYRNLELDYSAPSFNSPERIRFRHQLVGLDQDWVDAGTARSVSYPRLAPGPYVFRFTACNSDGVWNEKPVSIAFQITPAYWQTAWFRGLAVFVFSGLVAVGVRYRYVQTMRRKLRSLEQAHAIERERMRIARDIHDDLGARLTQMAFLSEITSNELGSNSKAGERLEKIATGSRQAIRSLEEIVWAVNPRKDTLPDFLDFLSHYANEFFRATEIRCRQDLPLMIPDIPLSSEVRHHLFLACKETLNNIHKHAAATEVWLRMKLTGSQLEVSIEDNGRGIQEPPPTAGGNGLLNLQARLAAIGGQCQVKSRASGGTSVSFVVNLPDGLPEKTFLTSPQQT